MRADAKLGYISTIGCGRASYGEPRGAGAGTFWASASIEAGARSARQGGDFTASSRLRPRGAGGAAVRLRRSGAVRDPLHGRGAARGRVVGEEGLRTTRRLRGRRLRAERADPGPPWVVALKTLYHDAARLDGAGAARPPRGPPGRGTSTAVVVPPKTGPDGSSGPSTRVCGRGRSGLCRECCQASTTGADPDAAGALHVAVALRRRVWWRASWTTAARTRTIADGATPLMHCAEGLSYSRCVLEGRARSRSCLERGADAAATDAWPDGAGAARGPHGRRRRARALRPAPPRRARLSTAAPRARRRRGGRDAAPRGASGYNCATCSRASAISGKLAPET